MSAAPLERVSELRLVDLLLREQESLSAVERFSQQHVDADRPSQERYYRDLIPAGAPAPGEQYAFRVDLDACTGCKACVTACHNLNGLGKGETWRDVGLLVGGSEEAPVLQTVTTACHHCEDPACLAGCPVRAYEKDPITGIVRHLDDQCIGCQYCVLKCPYDVPKYDAGLGIVRKCDMCSDRLAADEAPACVQGCPNEAISIELVRVGEAPATLLPAAAGTVPDSGYTRPTTRYVSARQCRGELRPADEAHLRPADPHHPLSAMLVLSQLAVGAFVMESLLGASQPAGAPLRVGIGGVAAALGLGVANLHLGRPRYAFRAFLGLRSSWMSREILALGAFATAAAATGACVLAPVHLPALVSALPFPLSMLRPGLTVATAGLGLLAVLCSVMIYADTRRAPWRLGRSAPLFFGTTATLGLGTAVVAGLLGDATPWAVAALATLWSGVAAAKLGFEQGRLDGADPGEAPSLERSRRLLGGILRPVARLRSALGWAAGVAVPAGLALGILAGAPAPALAGAAALALLLSAAGEWLERHLFFRTCVPVGMPGR